MFQKNICMKISTIDQYAEYAFIYNITFFYLLIIQFCKTAKDSQWFRNVKHPKNEHNY